MSQCHHLYLLFLPLFSLLSSLIPLDIVRHICYNWIILKKGGCIMGTEAERAETRKAMAYDLHKIIDRDPSQETYTKEEIKKIIDVYVETANQT